MYKLIYTYMRISQQCELTEGLSVISELVGDVHVADEQAEPAPPFQRPKGRTNKRTFMQQGLGNSKLIL